jgi:branched-chain amino acid transport system ATP-binding protein
MTDSVLVVEKLSKEFGGLHALNSVSLEARSGDILSVIGPNGAGKTTLFNCLTGIYAPDGGAIQMEGRPIMGLPPHQICRRGVARTFQNLRLFGEMSALDNVRVAQFSRARKNVWDLLTHHRRHREREKELENEARHWLEVVGLADDAERWARNLPYGSQRRLEIARALATHPRVLLLDEPGAGMNPSELDAMMDLIAHLRDRNLAIILIEHHMKVVMAMSDHILVLDHGEQICAGPPDAVRSDPRVIAAYLGKEPA